MTPRRSSTVPPAMLAHESALWQECVWQRYGLYFSESRLRLLHQSLWERMRQHGMHGYQEYYQYIVCHPEGEREWQALLQLLLNHETSFFRHLPSFEALTGYVLPALMSDTQHGNTLTMWSVGCSLGQEAYSLAMAFLELSPPDVASDVIRLGDGAQARWQARVIASDISQQVLDKARRGQYKPYEMRSLPEPYRRRYFTALGEGHHLVYQVVQRVQAMVEFHHMNLHDPDSCPPLPPPFLGGKGGGVDVIFCQNVLIYFKRESRSAIVQRLCQYLRPGGYFFLGPAEVVGLQLPGIQPVRFPDALIYQRIPRMAT